MDGFGPIIEHDGRPMPHLLGVMAWWQCESGKDNRIVEGEGRITSVQPFDWSLFATVLSDGTICSRTLRYRLPASPEAQSLIDAAKAVKTKERV